MKKVGVLTWHYYPNFGSALQAYALQETVKKLGYKVRILDYRDIRYGKISNLKDNVRYLCAKLFPNRFSYPFLEFQKELFDLTKTVQDPNMLAGISKGFDVLVCGSDQIWAPNVYNPIYMLSFASEGTNKVSYSASIGLNNIPDDLVDGYRSNLGGFSRISVRELLGAKLLREKCSFDVKVTLDPTLLIDGESWRRLEKEYVIGSDRYVFCYFLNAQHKYKKSVTEYAEKNNLKIIGCSASSADSDWMKSLQGKIGPKEFIYLINNAQVVFTDSYHGTIFSLLFHKDFLTFERFSNVDEICQNSRIYQLNDYFGLGKRILPVSEMTELDIPEYDYADFEKRLAELKEDSLQYLSSALEN